MACECSSKSNLAHHDQVPPETRQPAITVSRRHALLAATAVAGAAPLIGLPFTKALAQSPSIRDSASISAQLREFREDDEARWRYEAQEWQRQSKILSEIGRTNAQHKDELKKAGVNVDALEQDSKNDVERGRRVHQELLKIAPPPVRRGRKERLLMDQAAALAGSRTWIYPPAAAAWPDNAAFWGVNLALGEMNAELHSTGVGGDWGLGGGGAAEHRCTMWFSYVPAAAGNLLVSPHVDFQGSVAVSAHDHWYTATHARLTLKLSFDIFQHYWDGEETVTLIDEHRHDSSTSYWFDRHQIMSKTLAVSAGNIVWIKLTIRLWGYGQSDHAHVDCDFRTGANQRIRGEHIWVNLTPLTT